MISLFEWSIPLRTTQIDLGYVYTFALKERFFLCIFRVYENNVKMIPVNTAHENG